MKSTTTGNVNRETASERAARLLFRPPTSDLRPPTSGFTLIELLVVVLILLTLATITVSAINIPMDGDKVRAGARQVQSFLEGARNRAIFAKEPRGVRFLLDATDPRTVSSMVYIAPSEEFWSEGLIEMERLDYDNDGSPANADTNDPYNNTAPNNDPPLPHPENDHAWIVRGFDDDPDPDNATRAQYPTNWLDLIKQGVLRTGNRIRLPDANGTWYTVNINSMAGYAKFKDNGGPYVPPRLLLYQAYRELPTETSSEVTAFSLGEGPQSYQLELSPAQVPNQEPVQLPKGVVIHLDRCSDEPDVIGLRGNRLPGDWKTTTNEDVNGNNVLDAGEDWNQNNQLDKPILPNSFYYTQHMDLMFSPRGTVIGTAASSGLIVLYVGDQKDADLDRIDWAKTHDASWPTNYWPSLREYNDPPPPGSLIPGDGRGRSDKRLVSIFTRTGQVAVQSVHPFDEDVNGNGVLDAGEDTLTGTGNPAWPQRNPLRYVFTGEVAGR